MKWDCDCQDPNLFHSVMMVLGMKEFSDLQQTVLNKLIC